MKLLALIIPVIFFFSCQSEEEKFDKKIIQKPILTHAGIDSVLAKFDQVSFNDLDEVYLEFSDPKKKFSSKLKNEMYYVLKGEDIFYYIVGEYRIKNFVGHDSYYIRNVKHIEENHEIYWLVDKKVLYMLLDLILMLDEAGYNKYGFKVRESHRHPKLNQSRGGASVSQHIWGRAIDLVVEDINNDGKSTQADKKIVLEFAEKIVGNKGGIGLYPGTMTVHIDCRGKRARWNSY